MGCWGRYLNGVVENAGSGVEGRGKGLFHFRINGDELEAGYVIQSLQLTMDARIGTNGRPHMHHHGNVPLVREPGIGPEGGFIEVNDIRSLRLHKMMKLTGCRKLFERMPRFQQGTIGGSVDSGLKMTHPGGDMNLSAWDGKKIPRLEASSHEHPGGDFGGEVPDQRGEADPGSAGTQGVVDVKNAHLISLIG